MKRIKRFDEGGEAEGLSGTAGKEGAGKKPRSIDDMSFGKAFAMKRDELGAGKTFTWRGNKYTTDLEKKQTPTAAQAEVEPKAEAPATGRSAAFEESRDVAPAPKAEAKKPASTIGEALSARFGTSAQRKEGKKKGTRSVLEAILGRLGTQRQREEYKRGMRSGGSVKKYVGGGAVKSSASRRGDGIASRGKTRGKLV